MAKRILLQVRLTEDARAGLDRIASRRGVTITALFEAIGQLQPPIDDEVVDLARSIDRERRSRR
jgi:hypothetical protein